LARKKKKKKKDAKARSIFFFIRFGPGYVRKKEKKTKEGERGEFL